MDDSILTIIFYVGIIIVISLSKLVSKSLKDKKESTFPASENLDESDDYVMADLSSKTDYFQNRFVEENKGFFGLDSAESYSEGESVFTVKHHVTKENPTNVDDYIQQTTPFYTDKSSDLLPFIAQFDAKAAIIYSEILKRPEY